MAGHSHSANIARRKGAVDKKRAKVFSKCAKAIISAVKQGGPEADQNLKLKYAIEKAKAANMPKENILRAIKSGAGDKSGDMDELVYEGYAPAGVAVMVTALTDNRNRTASDLKHIFDKRGGNLGAQGSVGFLFDFRAILVVQDEAKSEEDWMELALECGAQDVEVDGDVATFYADPTEFVTVQEALAGQGCEFLQAELGYVPQNSVAVEEKDDAKKVLKLIEALEDNDDVQTVYANFDIQDDWLEELSA